MTKHVLYGSNLSPFVRKVQAVLELKKIDHDFQPVMPPSMGEDAEHKKMSPMGKIPFYQFDGKPLADSSVICTLLERVQPTPPIYPDAPYDHARALWFEEYSDTAMMQAFGMIFFEQVAAPAFFNRPTNQEMVTELLEQRVPAICDYMELETAGKQYLVGDQLTIADIAVATFMTQYQFSHERLDAKRWPAFAGYVKRLLETPMFARQTAGVTACLEQMQQKAGAAS